MAYQQGQRNGFCEEDVSRMEQQRHESHTGEKKRKVYDGVNGDIGDTYVEVDMGAQTVYYYQKRKT